MLAQRERPRTPPARALMPPPAPLPSLRDALARRASVFGPVEVDEAPTVPLGPWRSLGEAARRALELLADRVRP